MKLIFLDFSTCLETVRDLESKARGGMVTSLFRVTDHLTRMGHEVFVLSDIKNQGKTPAGTVWCAKDSGCHLKEYDWDFLVCNRGIGEGYTGIHAKHRILWTHDLPHNGFIQEPKMIKAFSATVFMSRYAERIWRHFYPHIGKSFRIPNGIDRVAFYPREKDYNYLIYGSAPNRGLKRLPLIFEAIKSRVGHQQLYMKAFSNLESLHPNEARLSHDHAAEYKAVEQSQVELVKPVKQSEFAKELGQASLMIMPSDYPEICSNVVLQALASGVPIITTGNLGATGEWVKNGKNGYLTKYHVHDYMIHTLEITRMAVQVISNRGLHRKMIRKASQTKNILDWKEVTLKWDRMFRSLI